MLLGVSIQRNENLANVFYRLNLIEAFGTGIPKIMRCYAEYSQVPEIIVTDNAFKIILPNTSNNNASSEKAFSNEEKIMRLVSEKKSVNRKEVENLLDISQASAARILRKMADENKIKKVGSGKNVSYIKRNAEN